MRLILGVFGGAMLASAIVLGALRHDITGWEAFHVSMLDAFGGASADLNASTPEQVIASVLSFAGIALIPLLTASVVDAVVKSRLELRDGTLEVWRA